MGVDESLRDGLDVIHMGPREAQSRTGSASNAGYWLIRRAGSDLKLLAGFFETVDDARRARSNLRRALALDDQLRAENAAQAAVRARHHKQENPHAQ